MDDSRISILNNSVRTLSKLQLLSAFFRNDLVYKIYMRSQVVHQLFDENKELDINKLELFHLQFSTPLIELLKKIKKNNEQSVSLLMDEVNLNAGLISQIHTPVFTQQSFDLDKQRQALKVSTSLRKLYQVLSENSQEYPLSRNINAFSARFFKDFYYTVDPATMNVLDGFDTKEVYKNAYAVIHRKLMGLLCKHEFKISFHYGLKAGEQIAEVYQVTGTQRYFTFFPARVLFLLCDMTLLKNVEQVTELSRREAFIFELQDKNDHLNNKIATVRTNIPTEITGLLGDHYKKLTDIDFLQNISKIDVQANILKSMLNTDMM